MKNKNKKEPRGLLFIHLFIFCIGMRQGAPDWNATFKNSRDPEETSKRWVPKMCILLYRFLKERRAKWHLYLKYAQMFLQTTELCLPHLQDKGSPWLPVREEWRSTQHELSFKSPQENSLFSKKPPRPTASQTTAYVINFIYPSRSQGVSTWGLPRVRTQAKCPVCRGPCDKSQPCWVNGNCRFGYHVKFWFIDKVESSDP